MDYAYYGRTLDRTEQFLKRDDMFGNAENLIKMAVDVPLEEEYTGKFFNTLFSYNRFKYYSYVGKLRIENICNVFRQSSPETACEFQGNMTKGIRKLYWFNVFDSYIKNDYKDCTPVKEYNALYNHYLSPKAIQLYLEREMKRVSNSVQ